MSNEQRIESFEARIRKLEEENANQKQKLLTHEVMTGLMLTNVLRLIDSLSPNTKPSQKLLESIQKAQAKIPDSDARNDPHTKDAFEMAIKAVNRALK
ncbi:hypothetical protein [Enterobacter hormaechei]|uniref:hypothetical protein n=1 Tax=Enterobacter hormaechei TaxID=158836 RepID=UPI0034CE24D3